MSRSDQSSDAHQLGPNDPEQFGRGEFDLEIPGSVLQEMVEHCQIEAPLEACGLLGGAGRLVSSHHAIDNLEASPSRYRADMRQVIDVVRSLRRTNAEILAIYHSHPSYPPTPSKTDLAENYDWGPTPRIIVSLMGPQPENGVWRFDAETFEALRWRIIPDPPREARQ